MAQGQLGQKAPALHMNMGSTWNSTWGVRILVSPYIIGQPLGISFLSMYKHIWLKKNNYRITAQGCSPLTLFQNGYENTRHKRGCLILSILYLCRIVAGWASSTKRQADMHERSGAFRLWIDVIVLISLVVSCCFCKWPMELVAWSDWTNNALPNVMQMFNADASFPALHYFSTPMGSTQIHLTVVHNHGGK